MCVCCGKPFFFLNKLSIFSLVAVPAMHPRPYGWARRGGRKHHFWRVVFDIRLNKPLDAWTSYPDLMSYYLHLPLLSWIDQRPGRCWNSTIRRKYYEPIMYLPSATRYESLRKLPVTKAAHDRGVSGTVCNETRWYTAEWLYGSLICYTTAIRIVIPGKNVDEKNLTSISVN